MAAVRIDLADDVRSRIATRAAEGGFPSVEAYIEALLVADAAGPSMSDSAVEQLLLNRVNGPFVEMDDADFRQMREKLKDRLERGQEPQG
jgi:hypothetical protein